MKLIDQSRAGDATCTTGSARLLFECMMKAESVPQNATPSERAAIEDGVKRYVWTMIQYILEYQQKDDS